MKELTSPRDEGIDDPFVDPALPLSNPTSTPSTKRTGVLGRNQSFVELLKSSPVLDADEDKAKSTNKGLDEGADGSGELMPAPVGLGGGFGDMFDDDFRTQKPVKSQRTEMKAPALIPTQGGGLQGMKFGGLEDSFEFTQEVVRISLHFLF